MSSKPVLFALPASLRQLYPFTPRTVDVEGGRMSCVVEGRADAPAIVLLHGHPTWSFLYREVIPGLAETMRVFAPDMIGFGLSDKPPDTAYHSLERHAANLAGLVTELALKNFTIVAHGSAGPVALAYTAAQPDTVSRIVFVNSFLYPLGAAGMQRLARVRGLDSGDLSGFLNGAVRCATRDRLPAAVVDAYRFPFPAGTSTAGVLAFARMFEENSPVWQALAEAAAKLKKWSSPVEVYYGLHDPLLTKLPAFMIRDTFKNYHQPVAFEAGHLLPEEAASAMVARITAVRKPASVLPILP